MGTLYGNKKLIGFPEGPGKQVWRLCSQINAQPHDGTILTGQEMLLGYRSLSLVLLFPDGTVTFRTQTCIGLYWGTFSTVCLHCIYLYW